MRLIVLDRDGVINFDSDDYIKSPDEWAPIPGSLEAIARFNHAGYKVWVTTNQSGLARGLFDAKVLEQIHDKMRRELARVGGAIEAIYFCPHGPDEGCLCRKPRPGLLRELAGQLQCDLAGVPAVGDSLSDIQAAQAVGARPILVLTGKGLATLEKGGVPADVPVYNNLAAVADALL